MNKVLTRKDISYRYKNTLATGWVQFLTILTGGDVGKTAQLVDSSGNIIVSGRKNRNSKLEFGEFDLRLASTTLLTEMFTAIGTASAPTPQTPHASTGGLVLANNGSIVLNNVNFEGNRFRNNIATFVLDVFNDADIATSNTSLGSGFYDASAGSVIGGAISKSAATYIPAYIFTSPNTPSISGGSALTVSMASGLSVETECYVSRVGNIASPDDRGTFTAGCRVSNQTTGGFTVGGNSAAHATNQVDLKAFFVNNGWDGTNVTRLTLFTVLGQGVQV